MLEKFVYWTGALDFLVAAGTYYGAFVNPPPGAFVALITLGSFLMMAAACLMWASRNIAARAPVIVWQGLVRLTAVSAALFALFHGLSSAQESMVLPYVIPFDGIVGLTYVIGSAKVTGKSPLDLLLCRVP